VTVCDREGVKFVKSSMKITITQIQYTNVQQILVVRPIFEFAGAARGFMIMSCNVRPQGQKG